MAGGIGGVIVSKVGGWLFDSYKAAGIAESWVAAKASGLGDYVTRIQAMNLKTKFGDVVSLDKIDLKGLSKEVADQLKNIDSASFNKLLVLQKPFLYYHVCVLCGGVSHCMDNNEGTCAKV
jgi:MFS transporter, ACS family, hexuronate transporter